MFPGTSESIKQVAQSAMKSNNPRRILKSVLDLMSARYKNKEYTPISVEEILTCIDLTELRTDIRQQLYMVCTSLSSHALYLHLLTVSFIALQILYLGSAKQFQDSLLL